MEISGLLQFRAVVVLLSGNDLPAGLERVGKKGGDLCPVRFIFFSKLTYQLLFFQPNADGEIDQQADKCGQVDHCRAEKEKAHHNEYCAGVKRMPHPGLKPVCFELIIFLILQANKPAKAVIAEGPFHNEYAHCCK